MEISDFDEEFKPPTATSTSRNNKAIDKTPSSPDTTNANKTDTSTPNSGASNSKPGGPVRSFSNYFKSWGSGSKDKDNKDTNNNNSNKATTTTTTTSNTMSTDEKIIIKQTVGNQSISSSGHHSDSSPEKDMTSQASSNKNGPVYRSNNNPRNYNARHNAAATGRSTSGASLNSSDTSNASPPTAATRSVTRSAAGHGTTATGTGTDAFDTKSNASDGSKRSTSSYSAFKSTNISDSFPHTKQTTGNNSARGKDSRERRGAITSIDNNNASTTPRFSNPRGSSVSDMSAAAVAGVHDKRSSTVSQLTTDNKTPTPGYRNPAAAAVTIDEDEVMNFDDVDDEEDNHKDNNHNSKRRTSNSSIGSGGKNHITSASASSSNASSPSNDVINVSRGAVDINSGSSITELQKQVKTLQAEKEDLEYSIEQMKRRHAIEIDDSKERLKSVQSQYVTEYEKIDKLEFQLTKIEREYEVYKSSHTQSNDDVNKQIDELKDTINTTTTMANKSSQPPLVQPPTRTPEEEEKLIQDKVATEMKKIQSEFDQQKIIIEKSHQEKLTAIETEYQAKIKTLQDNHKNELETLQLDLALMKTSYNEKTKENESLQAEYDQFIMTRSNMELDSQKSASTAPVIITSDMIKESVEYQQLLTDYDVLKVNHDNEKKELVTKYQQEVQQLKLDNVDINNKYNLLQTERIQLAAENDLNNKRLDAALKERDSTHIAMIQATQQVQSLEGM